MVPAQLKSLTIGFAASRPLYRRRFAVLMLALFASCTLIQPDTVQDISAWGMGWQFKAVQNRIGPAIPPMLAFLRNRYPGAVIEPAKPPPDLAEDFRAVVFGLKGETRDQLDRRLIGVFTAEGLPCAAAGFPVRDGDSPVAAILALDISVQRQDPATWRLCHGGGLPTVHRNAFKALILREFRQALGIR